MSKTPLPADLKAKILAATPGTDEFRALIRDARAVAAELRKVAEDLRAAVDALKEHPCAPTPDRQ
jgi:hypothetical protein